MHVETVSSNLAFWTDSIFTETCRQIMDLESLATLNVENGRRDAFMRLDVPKTCSRLPCHRIVTCRLACHVVQDDYVKEDGMGTCGEATKRTSL